MDKKDRRKIENIIREPLTRHRFMLNNKVRGAQDAEKPQPFTLEDLKAFCAGIRSNTADFQQEILNALEAVQTGKAPQTPKFDTPEKQLVWGAALVYLKLNPDAVKAWTPGQAAEEPATPLAGTALWKQISGTSTAYQELLSHAHHIREALRDKDTKYAWGEPGSGFSYDRQKNIINIDLMQTMIVGFEHARADVYREIGHALLSINYPKRMQQLYKEMQPLMQKARKAAAKKGPELKPEEYKKLRLLSTEWQLRHMMFNAAEENVANRFVANMGQQMLQDYSVSLNNTAVTHRAIGLTRLPEDKNASEELRRYMNLCNTVQLSFFQNNALFDNTDIDWLRVGINPAMVRKSTTLASRPDDAKNDDDGISHPDFQHLRELCGGPKGLENLQPKQHERLYGWNNLMGRVAQADQARKKIIEEIWRLYAEDLIQKILTQANDQVDQQLKDAQEQKQQQDKQKQDKKDKQKGEKQDGQEQEGEGQEGEGQEGEGQEGEGQEGEGQEGQGQEGQGQGGQEGQAGGKPQKGKGQKGKPQRGQQQGEPQDADDMDGEPQDSDAAQKDGNKDDGKKDKDKQDKKDKQKGEKQDGKEKSDSSEGAEEGQGQEGEGAESELGKDDENSVPVEGAGDMPDVEQPTEIPSDETDPGADGQDADGEGEGEGQDADGNAMTEDDLEKEAKKAEKAEQDAEGEGEEADADAEADADGEGKEGKQKTKPGKPGKPSKQAGHSDGKSLADLAKQDWTDYPKRISELSGPIGRVRKIFKEVQKRQLQRKTVTSRTLDILPENGEVKDRFNMEAHRSLTIKKLTGGVEEHDLKRFHKDEDKLVPTEIDIVIMIDGSGSMGQGGYGSSAPSPLQSALQASAILYEAAAGKDMKMNVYVGMWGSSTPPIIITPGADRMKIGQAMEAAKKGLNSGTDFAPAIVKVAETIGDQHGKNGTLSGFTHVLILSDGDIFDDEKAKERIRTMFTYSDKVTFDAAIITAEKGSRMEAMAKSIKALKPFQEVGVVLGKNPNEVPMEIVGLLLDKIRKCGSFTAVPNSKKRRAMKNAHNKMNKD